MKRSDYIRMEMAKVEREIEAINADPNHGFRDDESACYHLHVLSKELEKVLEEEA